MKLEIYQVDAFTNRVFSGNPAAVCPLKEWLDDELMLKIAIENAVAETAFIVQVGTLFEIRWFTPEIEMDLCGHATLAAAHVIFRHLGYGSSEITFHSKSGKLLVHVDENLIHLNFPSRMPKKSIAPKAIIDALSIKPVEIYKSRDYVLLYETEEQVKALQVNKETLDQINLDPGGVVTTAKGNEVDFVSRYFTPQASILEDPVTGSAHCSLIPFWAAKLNKNKLLAMQLSSRLGTLLCENEGDRVIISGEAVTYLQGNIWI